MLFRFRHFVTGYRSRAIWFSSCGRAPRADVKLQAPCPVWVKLRRTQREQMSSGLPLKADIAQHSRHVSKVPEGDMSALPINRAPTASDGIRSVICGITLPQLRSTRGQATAIPLGGSLDGADCREDKMVEMTGGCLCGQVRYSATADPAFVGVCHCANCQKQTGTAFSVVVGIPKSAMSIQGKLKIFHDTGDSGQAVERTFCPECGSPISTDAAVMPGITLIKAGTLDDTSWIDPQRHVYCDTKQRWILIPEGVQKFAKMPV